MKFFQKSKKYLNLAFAEGTKSWFSFGSPSLLISMEADNLFDQTKGVFTWLKSLRHQ